MQKPAYKSFRVTGARIKQLNETRGVVVYVGVALER